jgi:hypothetical protein
MSEAESSRASTGLAVEEERQCTACGTFLAGPFEPRLDLTKTVPEQELEQKVTVMVRAWVCPGCGLAHWYAPGPDLEDLGSSAGTEEDLAPKPGASYERRMQVLRMLRRVRRM